MKTTLGTMVLGAAVLLGCGRSDAASAPADVGNAARGAADAGAGPAPGPEALPHEDARRLDHLERARDLERRGDLAGALVEARRAAWDGPGQAPALEAVARLALRRGDRPLALSALSALAAARPQDPRPHLRIARLHLQAREPERAEAAAMEAMQRAPLCARGWYLKGRAGLQRGAPAEAARDLDRATRLDPRDPWAWNNLGYARLLAGEPGRAAVALERARARAPHLACVHNNLGVAYEQLGRLDEAQLAYGRALDLDPRHAHAAAHFARTAELLGWMGPPAGEPDEGLEAEPGSEGFDGDWDAVEADPAAALAGSWVLQDSARGAKDAADDPSGSDLREPHPAFARPLVRAGNDEPRRAW